MRLVKASHKHGNQDLIIKPALKDGLNEAPAPFETLLHVFSDQAIEHRIFFGGFVQRQDASF